MRRWLNFLPWVAAISVAAFAGVLVYLQVLKFFRPATGLSQAVQHMFPIAFGLCFALALPLAVWLRVSRGWAVTIFLVIAGTVALLLVSAVGRYYHGASGEAAGWLTMIALFYVLPVGLLLLVPVVGCVAFVCLPAGALVLFLSGEMKAIRRNMSILDLPHGRLRSGLLALVALAPLTAFDLPETPGTPATRASLRHRPAPEEGCQTLTPTKLSFPTDMVYVDVDKPDWPELKQLIEQFGAAHDMHLIPPDRSQLGFKSADPDQYGLCAPGKLVIRLSTHEDMGGRTVLFEPTGERYVVLSAHAAARDRSGERTLRELLAAIDARWPGTRFQTKTLDLGPSLTWQKYEPYACRTKLVARDYQECLGPRSDIRKEALFVYGKSGDWQRLQDVMGEFAAAHAMAFTPDRDKLPMHSRACSPGLALINADGLHGVPRPIKLPLGTWGVQIDTWVPPYPEPLALVDELAAKLEAEWPGVLRSRPERDFCRAAKALKP